MASKAILLALLALCGCTTIDAGKRVEGWPTDWKVTYHKVTWGEVISHCSQYSNPLTWPPLACTEFLKDRTAHVWYFADAQLEHENAHIAGYDHPGGDGMQKLLGRLHGS